MANNHCQTRRRRSEQSRRRVIRIDVLPDDVLLGIFDFCVKSPWLEGKAEVDRWQPLVHVCRRWRSLIFRSPRRLNLRLYCTPQTPARDTLDVWPAWPLIVRGYDTGLTSGTDNIIAALGRSNRVCQVYLEYLKGWQLEEVLAAMQVPFPELTHLWLKSEGGTLPVIQDSFLGGSAPHLQSFSLSGIPLPGPGLPNLLLSATHLVHLHLSDIPHSGYISPEAIVTLLSVLSSLEQLTLQFLSPQSRPDRLPPPSKRSVIAALRYFYFKGVIEYVEDLVTRIYAPQLEGISINFFNQIDFDTPRLAQFINRTPKLGKRDAHVLFYDKIVHVGLSPGRAGTLEIAISCIEPDWQLSSIEQVCNSCLQPLSTVEELYIEHHSEQVWNNEAIENTLWLQLLLPFTAVKYLFLSKEFAPGIAAVLQELVGGRITEVLPSLRNIFVKGLEPSVAFQKNTGQFVDARQLSGHIIAISEWPVG